MNFSNCMRSFRGFILFVASVILTFSVVTMAHAQGPTPASSTQSGLDIVSLKNGKTVRGALLKADAIGPVTIAVQRSWLANTSADMAKKVDLESAQSKTTSTQQLQERLKKLLAKPSDEQQFQFFLQQELERVETLLAAEKPAVPEQFVWLDLPRESIAKVTRGSADRKRIVLWAWSERLDKVETRDTHDLERELKKLNIDPSSSLPDLSDRLPPRVQSDDEWSARMAIVRYGLVKPLDFQGTGDVLVRSDTERKAVDLAPVLMRVFRTKLDAVFKELAGEPTQNDTVKVSTWIKPATREAESLSMDGFRATRVDVNVDRNQSVVESAFAAHIASGQWEILWADREVQSATAPRAELEGRITNDPQIKQVLETVKSLGLGADDQVRRAIQFGAATMAAQQASDAKFFEFRDRYLKRLDTPPLVWSR